MSSESLFENGPTIRCACKKGGSVCSTQRIRGRCAKDPTYDPDVPTTVAPDKCWFIKPPLSNGYELAGPCFFPLSSGSVCRLKCPNGDHGYGQCFCKNGRSRAIDSKPLVLTYYHVILLQVSGSTESDFTKPSCEFIVPKVCIPVPTTIAPATGPHVSIGCQPYTENKYFKVDCDKSHMVGPGTKCLMTCVGDLSSTQHEVRL